MSGTIATPLSGTVSPTILFNEIPYTWAVPGNYLEVRPDYSRAGLFAFPTRVLIVGQKLAAGTGNANQIYPLYRTDQAAALFGNGSVAAQMASAFLNAQQANPQVDIIALADTTGTAATGSFPFVGTATAAGQVALSIGGVRVLVPVSSGDTNTTIAVNAAALVATMPSLPATAAAATGSLNLTAKHVGVVGNMIDLEYSLRPDDTLPPGITIGTVVAMNGGVGTPTLATVLSTIASQWYTDIIVPWTDSGTLGVLTTELARRYTATGRLDMMAWAGLTGSYSSQLTAVGGAVVNSPFLTLANWPNMIDPPWVTAAAAAAVGIFNLTNDPARQLKGLAIPGLTAPLPANRLIETQENNFLNNGLSVFRFNRDGSVIFYRQITTSQQSSLGVADYSWRDVMVAKTMTRIRWDWKNYLSLTYPRNKLADDGSVAAEYDDTIVTPRRLANVWRGRSRLYEQQGWIENSALTAADSVFTRDTSDRNRVNARQRLQIIGNMMVFAGALEFEV